LDKGGNRVHQRTDPPRLAAYRFPDRTLKTSSPSLQSSRKKWRSLEELDLAVDALGAIRGQAIAAIPVLLGIARATKEAEALRGGGRLRT
jgi:hypothetical protein